MPKLIECHFAEPEYKEYLFGADAAINLRIFLESNQNEFDKDYLIEKMLESYEKRMAQELPRFKSED